jgi:Phasin protein
LLLPPIARYYFNANANAPSRPAGFQTETLPDIHPRPCRRPHLSDCLAKALVGRAPNRAGGNAFEFAHKFVQVKGVQDLVKLQTEFIQSQMQAMTEQVKDLSETATKTVMDAVKGVGGPHGEGGASS